MIVENEDGGLNIKFSRADLVAIPPSDFKLLQLFVEALTEEYGKEEINDSPHGKTHFPQQQAQGGQYGNSRLTQEVQAHLVG